MPGNQSQKIDLAGNGHSVSKAALLADRQSNPAVRQAVRPVLQAAPGKQSGPPGRQSDCLAGNQTGLEGS
jgi:hypothetical protein